VCNNSGLSNEKIIGDYKMKNFEKIKMIETNERNKEEKEDKKKDENRENENNEKIRENRVEETNERNKEEKEDKKEDEIKQIFINNSISIEIRDSFQVKEIFCLVKQKGVQIEDEMRVIFKGKQLELEKNLNAYNIKNNDNLELLNSFKGGGACKCEENRSFCIECSR
jgi:hypothetical protein